MYLGQPAKDEKDQVAAIDQHDVPGYPFRWLQGFQDCRHGRYLKDGLLKLAKK